MDNLNNCFEYHTPYLTCTEARISTRYHYDDLYNYISPLSITLQQEEGNENMEKKFYVMSPSSITYKTYEDAEKNAKKYADANKCDYAIMQAIALAQVPTPAIEVVKL